LRSFMAAAANKKNVDQFKQVTGCDDKTADECLKKHNYNLQRSLNYYYSNRARFPAAAASPVKKADKSKLEAIFDKYSGSGDKEKDLMFDEKLQQFFSDMKIDPAGVGPLAIAWKLGAAAPGEFTRHEFVKGWNELGVDTVDKLRDKVAEIIKSLADKAAYKDFYRWLFTFARENSEIKSLDTEVALDLWNTVFPGNWGLADKWIAFIQKQNELAKAKKGGIKCVSRDIWDQVLEFSRDIQPDLSNWEDDGAWPVIIDEFVEFVNEGKGKKK